jgi:hypothetical protein
MIEKKRSLLITWCPSCGWEGNSKSFVYIIGENAPVRDEDDPIRNSICPECKKSIKRDLSAKALVARFRFELCRFQKHQLYREGSECFPCRCQGQKPRTPIGLIALKFTVCGDTCFCSYEEWMRVFALCECVSCKAQGKVAMIEKHSRGDIYKAGWDEYHRHKEIPLEVEKVKCK